MKPVWGLVLGCTAALLGFRTFWTGWSRTGGQLTYRQITAADLVQQTVPFYVYESPLFRVFDTCDRAAVDLPHHSSEFEFLRLIEEHPWRVADPEDAVLFVVPFLMGSVEREACPDVDKEAIQELTNFIASSPYFQRHQGADHLLVFTDWKVRKHPHFWLPFWEIAKNFIVAYKGSYEVRPWRCTAQIPYTMRLGNETVPATRRAAEYLNNRPYNFFFQGQTYPDPGYDKRRAAAAHLKGVLEPSLFVSVGKPNPELPPCSNDERVDGFLRAIEAGNVTMPANPDDVPRMEPCWCNDLTTFHLRLKHSKLNLMLKGTDPSSSRLFESVRRGVATLVLNDGHRHFFTPFECSVDWENLVFWGSEKEFLKNPEEYLTKYVSALTTEDYDRVLRTMERHKADLDWYHAESRVATNILYSAARKCLPGVSSLLPCEHEDKNET